MNIASFICFFCGLLDPIPVLSSEFLSEQEFLLHPSYLRKQVATLVVAVLHNPILLLDRECVLFIIHNKFLDEMRDEWSTVRRGDEVQNHKQKKHITKLTVNNNKCLSFQKTRRSVRILVIHLRSHMVYVWRVPYASLPYKLTHKHCTITTRLICTLRVITRVNVNKQRPW